MRLRLTLGLAAAVLAIHGSPARAQYITNFTFVNGGTVTAFGYRVGRYAGEMGPTNTPVTLNCVDFFNEVTNSETWNAWVTNLGTDPLSHTRLMALTASEGGGLTQPQATTIYSQAAWLVSQYANYYQATITPKDSANIANIQATIWDLFPVPSGSSAPPSPNSCPATVCGTLVASNYWATQDAANYSSINPNYFSIITDTRDTQSNSNYNQSAQEFIIYSTPEPGSLMLTMSGLVGLLGFTRYRRRTTAA